MRNIFYDDEYLYTKNLQEVFADNLQYAETIKFLTENNKVRVEDYIHRLDVAYDVAREFIVKGYPELLYNYYPRELKEKSLEDCLSGISEEFRAIIKETGYVSGYYLSKIREIQTFGFGLFHWRNLMIIPSKNYSEISLRSTSSSFVKDAALPCTRSNCCGGNA